MLVSGIHQTDSVLYKYVCVCVYICIFHIFTLHGIKYNSLSYTVGSYCLSVLCT